MMMQESLLGKCSRRKARGQGQSPVAHRCGRGCVERYFDLPAYTDIDHWGMILSTPRHSQLYQNCY